MKYRSLFVSNISKNFIAKELCYYYNLSYTLVSCIRLPYILIFKLLEKSVLKLKNKGLTHSNHVYNIGKAFLVLKIFMGRHTPRTIFLAAQNCFGIVPLFSRHVLETQT